MQKNLLNISFFIYLAIFIVNHYQNQGTLWAAVNESEENKAEIRESVANKPLTEFKQKITTSVKVKKIHVNETVKMPIRIKNITKQIWPGSYAANSVRLCYYWIEQPGKKYIIQGPRIFLPEDLAPGKSVTLIVTVTAPDKPGKYILQFTMVQEHVAWFEQKGAKTLDIPISVLEINQ